MGISEVCVISFLGLCSIDDIRTREIRIIEALIFGLLGVIIQAATGVEWTRVVTGLMVGGVIYLFSCMTNEEIGKGDAILIMIIGLYLGFFRALAALWFSSILVGIDGLYLILVKKKKLSYEVPFAPFLLIGVLIVMLLERIVGANI